ncbi:hypothetical protein C8R43DRAFT_1121962 [Mycena crocata]|nr:hypothetical protein C8R43DRAFT_1121962 [Mycena crocata]
MQPLTSPALRSRGPSPKRPAALSGSASFSPANALHPTGEQHPVLHAGRVAVVTGAASGIGAAAARAFAALGMKIAIADVHAKEGELRELGRELEGVVSSVTAEGGTHVLVVPTDVTVVEDVRRLREKVYEAWSRRPAQQRRHGAPSAALVDALLTSTSLASSFCCTADVPRSPSMRATTRLMLLVPYLYVSNTNLNDRKRYLPALISYSRDIDTHLMSALGGANRRRLRCAARVRPTAFAASPASCPPRRTSIRKPPHLRNPPPSVLWPTRRLPAARNNAAVCISR